MRRVLLLVNPHNPTGRVFDPAELEIAGGRRRAHDLIVVSDEIHAELTYGRPTIPFASLGTAIAARTVTITSATKAFNIAGLRAAVAHVGLALRVRGRRTAGSARRDERPRRGGHPRGLAGRRAWRPRLSVRLRHNRDLVQAAVDGTPGLSMRLPEAGYLAWIDCADADLGPDPAAWFPPTRASN